MRLASLAAGLVLLATIVWLRSGPHPYPVEEASVENRPIRIEAAQYVNPLPHVLMLTAIVVGVATTSVALALTVRIKEQYGTVEEDEIVQIDRERL